MSDYQAVYDAVRSRLSNTNVGDAVESVLRDINLSHHADQVAWAYKEAAAEQMRPSILLKPKLFIDGDMWCAIYGDNLQDGVAGFGKSPSDAMHNFDKNYHTNLTAREKTNE